MEQASKTPAFLPFRNQEFQAVVSLPRHKGLGSCQGPFHSPALPSPAGLCQSYPPHTRQFVPLCSTPGPAHSSRELHQRPWYPHRSGCPKRLLPGRERVGNIS